MMFLKVDVIITSPNRTKCLHEVVEAISRLVSHKKIILVDGSTNPVHSNRERCR